MTTELTPLVLTAFSGGVVALLLTLFGGGGSVLAVPLLLSLLGALGGVFAFGFLGLFLGPVLLAVGYSVIKDWADQGLQPADRD